MNFHVRIVRLTVSLSFPAVKPGRRNVAVKHYDMHVSDSRNEESAYVAVSDRYWRR